MVSGDVDDEDFIVVTGRSKFLAGAMLGLSQQYTKHTPRRRSTSVVNWAVGFEKILEDPLGLKTFTEFLKREFSDENIMFWIVCEHYRLLPGVHERKKLAKEIFNHYLGPECPEPINIDCSARQHAFDCLEESPPDLFIPAQKQIFNLMKFDCYQRFLKSDLFTDSLTAEKNGKPYPCQDMTGSKSPRGKFRGRSKSRDRNRVLHAKKMNVTTSPTLGRNKNTPQKDADDKEEMDEKKRKSLLPWQKAKLRNSECHRSSSRSPVLQERNLNHRKSERTGKLRNRQERGSDTSGDTYVSDASVERSLDRMTSEEGMSSCELSSFLIQDDDSCQFCRITLPNSSTTILKTVDGETVGDVVRRLMEKHGLTTTAVDVFLEDNNQIVDLNTKFSDLRCKKIRVEKRIILRLELPSRKVIAVKAAPTHRCDEVLAPVLKRYGFDMQDVLLQFMLSNKTLSPDELIGAADGKKICVKTKEGIDAKVKELRMERPDVNSNLFDDVVNGRSVFWYDDLGVLDLEDYCRLPKESLMPGESSNGFDVLRRNSFTVNKENKGKSRSLHSNRASIQEGMGIKIQLKGTTHIKQVDQQVHQVEERSHAPRSKNRDSSDLTALWMKAQRQLDDQRGTEINCELPEFLRLPDNPAKKETAG